MKAENGSDLGMLNRPGVGQLTPVDVAAAALSIIWVLIAVVFVIFLRDDDGSMTAQTINGLVTAIVIVPAAGSDLGRRDRACAA